MTHRKIVPQHGVGVGVLLALVTVAFGFALQSDPVRVLHSGSMGVLAGIVLLTLVILFFRLKGEDNK